MTTDERLDRIESRLVELAARPVHLTVNITQGNVQTRVAAPGEDDTDEDMHVGAATVGFHVEESEDEA